MAELINDLVAPQSDAGVVMKLIVIAATWCAAAIAVRSNRDLLLFVTGLEVVALAWRGLAALH